METETPALKSLARSSATENTALDQAVAVNFKKCITRCTKEDEKTNLFKKMHILKRAKCLYLCFTSSLLLSLYRKTFSQV